MPSELKRLDVNANSFTANGNKYLIHPSLSVERFRQFERLQVSIGWNADFSTLATGVRKAYDHLQTMKAADASVVLHNLLNGIAQKQDGREHEMLLLCALFISREGENLADWSEAEAVEKIADWREEGFDVADFFDLAWRFVKGFTARSLAGSTGFSEDETATLTFTTADLSSSSNMTSTASGLT